MSFMELCRPDLKITKQVSFDNGSIEKISKKTGSLANPIRLKILKLLKEYDELCVCEIETALDLKQSKVSYHLATLIDGGVIKRRDAGSWSFYSLNSNAANILNFFGI